MMKKHLLGLQFFLLCLGLSESLLAQPAIQWEKTIGTVTDEYTIYSVTPTPDGGHILAASALSDVGGDKSQPSRGYYDFWIVKINKDGQKEWDKTIGGNNYDNLRSLLVTGDGGYLLGGVSASDISGEKSSDAIGSIEYTGDFWIVKLDKNGNKQWDKTIGGQHDDVLTSMDNTSDGGYILGGFSNSGAGFNKSQPSRGIDYWVVKISSEGVVQWDKTIGSIFTDRLFSVRQTADGGYILGGNSETYPTPSGDKTSAGNGDFDYWIVKLDNAGNKLWDRVLGGIDEERFGSVEQTSDGGYIVGGYSSSAISGDKTEDRISDDYWIVKLSADGAKEWDRARGGDSALSWCTNVIQTRDDNYIAYGITRSSAGGDKSEEKEGIWLIKFNSAGTKIWDKALGGFTYGNLAETADGGLILVGTALNDENQTEPSRGGNDYWIVKLAPENPSFSQTTLRINAGGADFTTGTKQRYIGDMYYAGIRRVTYHPGGNILGTTSDELYRTARSSPSFSYNIPVINGEVTVTLHFAETYFGVPGTRGKDGGAGSRRFHVNVEGSRQLTNYDIFAKAGGAMRANQISFPATVTDNVLNIDFLTGAADQPKVCAIEVVTENLTFYPIADAFVRGGIYSATNFGTSADLEVKTVSNDPEISRDSYIKFQMPSPETPIVSAKLRLYGHNHQDSRKIEIFAYEVDDNSWTETGITLNNAPYLSTYKVGGTTVSDNYQYYEFNVSSYLGNNKLAGNTEISFRISNTNSRNARFIFNSKEAGANPPQLLIQTVYGNARLGQEEMISEVQEKQSSIVFPNPIKHQFTVSLSPEHNGAISFEMVDAAGKSHFIPTPQNAKPGENAEIAISSLSLRTGIYLLKIESDSHKEAVRLVITE